MDERSGSPLGQPTLSFALDRCTHAVVGFYLACSHQTPGSLGVLRDVQDKGSVLKRACREFGREWERYAGPRAVIVDGRHAEDQRFLEYCSELGIDVLERGRADQKSAVIERFCWCFAQCLADSTKSRP